jgi:hypothetical protein
VGTDSFNGVSEVSAAAQIPAAHVSLYSTKYIARETSRQTSSEPFAGSLLLFAIALIIAEGTDLL